MLYSYKGIDPKKLLIHTKEFSDEIRLSYFYWQISAISHRT